MASVRIIFSPDRAAAASRLRDTISAEGYDAVLSQVSDLQDLFAPEEGEREAATILIWSRPLVAGALQPGALRQLRKNPRLIEVSADGVGPQAADGDTHVILLSGWRGQLFHPGWQRVAGKLKELCGPPATALAPAQAPEPAAAPVVPPHRTVESGRTVQSVTSGRRLRAGGIALAVLAGAGLFGAGFATSSWMTNSAERKAQSPIVSRAAPGSDVRVASSDGVRPGTAPRGSNSVPTAFPAGRPASNPPPGLADTGEAKTPKASPKKSTRSDRNAGASAPDKSRRPAAKETKRYSRRNSKLMRLFCQGSGRSTPECKAFVRDTRRTRR